MLTVFSLFGLFAVVSIQNWSWNFREIVWIFLNTYFLSASNLLLTYVNRIWSTFSFLIFTLFFLILEQCVVCELPWDNLKLFLEIMRLRTVQREFPRVQWLGFQASTWGTVSIPSPGIRSHNPMCPLAWPKKKKKRENCVERKIGNPEFLC